MGFSFCGEQVGMYLALNGICEANPDVELAAVASQAAAQLWEKLFSRTFGYRINHKLLYPKNNGFSCFIAYYHHEPVGTAMLHGYPEFIAGIHAVGIIPSMHRQGLGEKLMNNLLHWAKKRDFRYATLQASPAGKNLYQKLGFQAQFRL
jgi:GNAT superfamily N-acetyltransferase